MHHALASNPDKKVLVSTRNIPDKPPEVKAIADAHKLADFGVPVFACKLTADGQPIPPRNWEKTRPGEASHAAIDRWRKGMALCAVTGVVADVIDVDPRNGGTLSRKRMIADLGEDTIDFFWDVITPSNGRHFWIAPLGIGSRLSFLPGLDLKGGKEDGSGRGFVFIPPTVRPSQDPADEGKRRMYRPACGLEEPDGSEPCVPLAEYVLALDGQRTDSGATPGRQDPDELEAACLAAGPGEQRGALLRYVHELERRGYARRDIVTLCMAMGLRNFSPRRPWKEQDFRGLLHKEGEVAPDGLAGELDGLPVRPRMNGSRLLAGLRTGEWLNRQTFGPLSYAVPYLVPAGCPDSLALSFTGDIEIQLDVTLDNWNSAQALAGKWTAAGNDRSWLLLLNEDGTLTFAASANGTAIVTWTSTVAVPIPALHRMAIRVTLTTGTGLVHFYTSPAAANQVSIGSILTGTPVWTQLGGNVTSAIASVFNSASAIRVGEATTSDYPGYTGIFGKVHAFRELNGIAGPTVASPDFTVQTAGATSFADAQANTWTLAGTAEISNRRYRFHGEVAAWPQTWDPTGSTVFVDVTANGIMRRLGQNSKPLDSPIRRYWKKLSSNVPVVYWPCEDAIASTQFASGLANGLPLSVFTGSPTFAADSAYVGSGSLPVLNSSQWYARIPAFSGNDISLTFVMHVPSSADVTNSTLVDLNLTGSSVSDITLIYSTSAGVDTLTAGCVQPGIGTTTAVYTPNARGKFLIVRLYLQKSGADYVFGAEFCTPGGVVETHTSTITGAAGGTARLLSVNHSLVPGVSDNQVASFSIGHFALQGTAASLSADNITTVFGAFLGEAAGTRFSRLCSEEGIAFRSNGRLSVTSDMGLQTSQTLLSLLQECVDADRGVMFEPRQAFGLGYRTRYSLSNQSAAVALDYAGADLSALTPTDDDQNTLNDATVSRTSGSSSRQVVSSGPKSIQAPPNGVGTYDTAVTLNVLSDSQVSDEAGWLVHLGTVNEPRYPRMTLNFRRAALANVFYDLQDADIGDYYSVANAPTFLTYDGISQIIKQTIERIGGFWYEADWAGAPELPYETMVYSDNTLGRYDTDGSTLHTNINTVATSLSVDTTAGFNFALWTTAAGDFPFDIVMGGERMTVTSITGAASPQTFTVTRSVNGVVKSHSAGEAISLFHTPYFAM